MDKIKEAMLTQNKRSTSYPIFIVVEDKKVYGIDSDYSDDKERKDRDQIDHSWLCESCQALEEDDKELPEDCDECDSECFINFRVEKDVPNLRAGFFFTAEACNNHIFSNGHHYNSTAKSYAISAYHNEELKTVMRHIVGEEGAKSLS